MKRKPCEIQHWRRFWQEEENDVLFNELQMINNEYRLDARLLK